MSISGVFRCLGLWQYYKISAARRNRRLDKKTVGRLWWKPHYKRVVD